MSLGVEGASRLIVKGKAVGDTLLAPREAIQVTRPETLRALQQKELAAER